MKLKIGSHVGMSGKDMLLGSAKEAYSYGANVFMAYTGAPQNTRRKEISELKIKEAWEYMAHHNIDEIVIHAPYIINLANTIKPETYEIAEKFWQQNWKEQRQWEAELWFFIRVHMLEQELMQELIR